MFMRSGSHVGFENTGGIPVGAGRQLLYRGWEFFPILPASDAGLGISTEQNPPLVKV
jgi:hypothetical protein